MVKVNSLKMEDHSILILISSLLGAFGVKEIWSIVKQKIDELIKENTHLKIKIVKMENRLISNAKKKVETKRFNNETK